MDAEKLITRGAIAVPFIHVITCGLYIFGYAAGFGAQIGGMFSASDFFTITIQHLSAVYVIWLGLPLLSTYLLNRSLALDRGVDESIDRDETDSPRLGSFSPVLFKLLDYILPLIAFAFATLLFLQISTGSVRQYKLCFIMIWTGTLPVWWRTQQHARLLGVPIQMVWIIATFVIGVLGMSMEAGDSDRRLPYAKLKPGRLFCKEQIILTAIGERFITATKDNKRHIVNDECEDFASFETVPVAVEGPIWALIVEQWKAASGTKEPNRSNVTPTPKKTESGPSDRPVREIVPARGQTTMVTRAAGDTAPTVVRE